MPALTTGTALSFRRLPDLPALDEIPTWLVTGFAPTLGAEINAGGFT